MHIVFLLLAVVLLGSYHAQSSAMRALEHIPAAKNVVARDLKLWRLIVVGLIAFWIVGSLLDSGSWINPLMAAALCIVSIAAGASARSYAAQHDDWPKLGRTC